MPKNSAYLRCKQEQWDVQFGPKSLGAHELLDRAYVIGNMFEDFIVGHESIKIRPSLQSKAVAINKQLAELYILISKTIGEAKCKS